MVRFAWLFILAVLVGCAESFSSTTTADPKNVGAAPTCPFCAAEKETATDAKKDNGAATDADAAKAPVSSNDASIDLQVLDDEGIKQLIASKRGQVVVLDCWSTSCPTCMKEFSNLVRLQQTYGDKLACISLSFDYEGIGQVEDALPPVRKFLTQQQATFDNVISSVESDELYRKLELISIPAVFVYDRDGKLAKRFDNDDAKTEADTFTYAQVEEFIQQLLAE